MCSLTCSDAINWEKHELLHTVLDAIDMIPYSQVCSKRTHSIQVKDRRSELWEYTLECVLLECVLLQVKDRRSELWEYTLPKRLQDAAAPALFTAVIKEV